MGRVQPQESKEGRRHKKMGGTIVTPSRGTQARGSSPRVAAHHAIARDAREDLDAVARAGHRRRADEVRRIARLRRGAGHLHGAEGRLALAAEGVALDVDVEAADERLRGAVVELVGEQDHACAHAPGRLRLDKLLDVVQHVGVDQAHADRRRLAARQDESVDAAQLVRGAHLDGLDVRVPLERLHVLREPTLDRKHANLRDGTGMQSWPSGFCCGVVASLFW
jgi:hypothetical protein